MFRDVLGSARVCARTHARMHAKGERGGPERFKKGVATVNGPDGEINPSP